MTRKEGQGIYSPGRDSAKDFAFQSQSRLNFSQNSPFSSKMCINHFDNLKIQK